MCVTSKTFHFLIYSYTGRLRGFSERKARPVSRVYPAPFPRWTAATPESVAQLVLITRLFKMAVWRSDGREGGRKEPVVVTKRDSELIFHSALQEKSNPECPGICAREI